MKFSNNIRAQFLDFKTPCKIMKGVFGHPDFKVEKNKKTVEIIKTTDDCFCHEGIKFEEKGFNIIILCGFIVYPKTEEYDKIYPDEFPSIAINLVTDIDESFSEILKNYKKKIEAYGKYFDMSDDDDRAQFLHTRYCLLCDKISVATIPPEKVKAIFKNERIIIFTTQDLENITIDFQDYVNRETIRQTNTLHYQEAKP